MGDNKASKCHILRLPTELHLEIISYVVEGGGLNVQIIVSQVCKTWSDIIATTPRMLAERYTNRMRLSGRLNVQLENSRVHRLFDRLGNEAHFVIGVDLESGKVVEWLLRPRQTNSSWSQAPLTGADLGGSSILNDRIFDFKSHGNSAKPESEIKEFRLLVSVVVGKRIRDSWLSLTPGNFIDPDTDLETSPSLLKYIMETMTIRALLESLAIGLKFEVDNKTLGWYEGGSYDFLPTDPENSWIGSKVAVGIEVEDICNGTFWIKAVAGNTHETIF